MNKIKSMLFLAILVAITATTTLADGQIPIGGSPVAVGGQIPIGGSPVSEPNNEISSEVSDYLLTLVSIIGQLKF